MALRDIVVKQDSLKPVPAEVLADSIVEISRGIKKLISGPLTEAALLLLIQNAAPGIPNRGRYGRKAVSQEQIKAVLAGIESLEAVYLKPKPAK